ncbi:hypothetical protein M446_0187 [Methylobacterium sp. 4-46]|nr:hypothetical protein M446_0187 [Methylobacterium sp. 4-46]
MRAKPHDIDALRTVLIQEDLDPESYSLSGGTPDERSVLSRQGAQWGAFYSERGTRSDLHVTRPSRTHARSSREPSR